jgi:hypothetical protein
MFVEIVRPNAILFVCMNVVKRKKNCGQVYDDVNVSVDVNII